MGNAQEFVAVGQVLKVVAVGYARASPGLAKLARLADHLP